MQLNKSLLLCGVFRIYLHRVQRSLGSCFAETCLPPLVPKTYRNTRWDTESKKNDAVIQSECLQRLDKCEQPDLLDLIYSAVFLQEFFSGRNFVLTFPHL